MYSSGRLSVYNYLWYIKLLQKLFAPGVDITVRIVAKPCCGRIKGNNSILAEIWYSIRVGDCTQCWSDDGSPEIMWKGLCHYYPIYHELEILFTFFITLRNFVFVPFHVFEWYAFKRVWTVIHTYIFALYSYRNNASTWIVWARNFNRNECLTLVHIGYIRGGQNHKKRDFLIHKRCLMIKLADQIFSFIKGLVLLLNRGP